MKPDITPDDSDEWGDKLMNIKIVSFKSYLEYLDALQSLFNDISLYVENRQDWNEAWVVRCALRGLRCQWDWWEDVLEFYAKLDAILAGGGKEFAGYTMDFCFKKMTRCAKQLELRRKHQSGNSRLPGVAMMAQTQV